MKCISELRDEEIRPGLRMYASRKNAWLTLLRRFRNIWAIRWDGGSENLVIWRSCFDLEPGTTLEVLTDDVGNPIYVSELFLDFI